MEKRDYTKTTQLEDLSVTDTESMMLPHELVDIDLPNHLYAVGTDIPIYDYYKPDMKTSYIRMEYVKRNIIPRSQYGLR